eukprot:8228291-Ditylum_brightwellii.AAC.1
MVMANHITFSTAVQELFHYRGAISGKIIAVHLLWQILNKEGALGDQSWYRSSGPGGQVDWIDCSSVPKVEPGGKVE